MDELKQRFLYTSLELEQLKVEASEETRKNNEYMKQLIQLVKITCNERDEAIDQLQKVMNSVNANSCITESNSFSETFNHHSHGSSPAESFLNMGSSPELFNVEAVDYTAMAVANQVLVQNRAKVDHATLKIESLVKGKPLPQKGKFLQAVLDAAPLLQTLIVAAPLPRWRNPPQLNPFHIPPVSIKGSRAEIAAQGISANSHPYFNLSSGTTQMPSNTMLNVGNFPSATCLGSQMMISAGSHSYGHPGKRQRFL